MIGEVSSIIRELEQVQDQLSTLSDGAYDEKYALMIRKEELTTRAARLAEAIDTDCSTQELLIQLASLRRRRALLDRQHGAAQRGLHRSPHGRSQVDYRIERICSLLADRGIDVH